MQKEGKLCSAVIQSLKPHHMPLSTSHRFLSAVFSVEPDFLLNELGKHSFPLQRKTFNSIIHTLCRHEIDYTWYNTLNDESIEAWQDYTVTKWNSLSREDFVSPFEFLKRMATDLLVYQDDSLYFKIDKTSIWRELTFVLGEDLFVATLLADKNIKHFYKPIHFQWNYILSSNFHALNNLLQSKKLIDNHFHLFGSSPHVDLSWLYLMNHPTECAPKFKAFQERASLHGATLSTDAHYTQTDMYHLVRMAAHIRIILFKIIHTIPDSGIRLVPILKDLADMRASRTFKGAMDDQEFINVHKFSSSYKLPDRHAIDYAIKGFNGFENLSCLPIIGERHLLYACAQNIFTNSEDSFTTEVLFYLYLLIKKKFSGLFFQRNDKYGFDNFQKYQNNKLDFIRGSNYEKLAISMAIKDNIKENHLEQLETRISCGTTIKLRDNIEIIDGKRDGFFPHHFVLHFIKKKQFDWSINYKNPGICNEREAVLRAQLKKQAQHIVELRKGYRRTAGRILGIDAASHEVNCRPETFGQVYRYLSAHLPEIKLFHFHKENTKLHNLHKTYHVGEDFFDIADGLRSIDEALLFLDLKHGDRIGHGVALGINPEPYYATRPQIAMPLQNALDNTAWLLYSIEQFHIDVSTNFYAKLKAQFDKYFNKLQSKVTNKPSEFLTADLLAYIESWKLRGDNPVAYKKNFDNREINKYLRYLDEWNRFSFLNRESFRDIDKNIYNLNYRYHFDNGLKNAAKQIEVVNITKEYVELIKKVQISMRNRVLEKGVAVESCPSSNLLISKLENVIDLPIFQLFPIDESKAPFIRLNVSVNTDDQGVFFTSLVKEYTLLANALQMVKNEDGLRVYSDDAILHWIERLIKNGKQQSFKKQLNGTGIT